MPEAQVTATNTPFREAIDHFRRKVRVPVTTYRDLAGECHAKAFMVAGANNDALLADLHKTILGYMESGRSARDFRADFERIVKAHGWQYRGEPGWRSRVIINTNLRTSYMAGHWENLVAEREARPWLMYQQVQDAKKRPEHSQWHGLILPIDHEFWKTHYPPNGWGCRCTVVGVSAGQMRRNGWKEATDVPTSPGDIPEEWAYNVGMASRVSTGPENAEWEPLIQSRTYETYGRPEAVPLDKPRAAPGQAAEGRAAVRAAVEKMLGGQAGIFTGPDALTVGITAQSLGNHLKPDRAPLVPLIPEIIEDPFEIWLMPYRDKRTGRVELRRHYIKAFSLGKGLYSWFVAEFCKGELVDVTAIASSRSREEQKRRAGILVWGRK
ncbi:PBECR2 nuclease fold domain-containing protein [Desulfovibrio sp. SGI.169]|uniref:PBECR2 nuclease fold domain-containing protein n=1 Tax=Desulfovibrio sp. SGI.169 TaxID=3420561 RepID=UPI003D03452B